MSHDKEKFAEEWAAGLPPPHELEPGGLRSDIIDELADHLECSVHHELIRGTKTEQAWQRAIDRFGHPPTIARQLWWDYMRGTIMLQKLTLALVVCLAILCCGAMAMMWRQTNQNQTLVATLLAKLDEQSSRSSVSDQPAEWNQLEVICQDAAGKPRSGVSVRIESLEKNGIPVATQTVDDTGMTAFGQYLFGSYAATLTQEIDGERLSRNESFSIMPGQDKRLVIECPTVAQAPLQYRPKQAKKTDTLPTKQGPNNVWTFATLVPTYLDVDSSWQASLSPTTCFHVFVDPDGEMHALENESGPLSQNYTASGSGFGRPPVDWIQFLPLTPRNTRFSVSEVSKWNESIPLGSYSVILAGYAVANKMGDRFTHIAARTHDGQVFPYLANNSDDDWRFLRFVDIGPNAAEYRRLIHAGIEVKQDSENVFSLPDLPIVSWLLKISKEHPQCRVLDVSHTGPSVLNLSETSLNFSRRKNVSIPTDQVFPIDMYHSLGKVAGKVEALRNVPAEQFSILGTRKTMAFPPDHEYQQLDEFEFWDFSDPESLGVSNPSENESQEN